MRFQLFSDIHIELLNEKFPKLKQIADILILAGDIGKVTMKNFQDFIKYCSEKWKTVIYVLGNHEFYGNHSMDTILEKFKIFFSQFSNVYLLNNSFIVIDNITFYGFTGWTKPIFNSNYIAREYINDYNMIKTKQGKFKIEYHRYLSEYQIQKFKEFINTIDSNRIIVITHFPPIQNGTSNPIYNGKMLNNYFSWYDMLRDENISTNKIKFWLSGHTHWSYDFIQNNIRYIANQVGYVNEDVLFSEDSVYELI